MCCPPAILLAGAAPPTAARCQLLHIIWYAALHQLFEPCVVFTCWSVCRSCPSNACCCTSSATQLFTHHVNIMCCSPVALLAGAAPPTEKQVSAAARHLLRSCLPTIDAQAPLGNSALSSNGCLLSCQQAASSAAVCNLMRYPSVAAPAGAAPPTEKQVSAAARQLLRTLVMEHQTIEEWDSAPGAYHQPVNLHAVHPMPASAVGAAHAFGSASVKCTARAEHICDFICLQAPPRCSCCFRRMRVPWMAPAGLGKCLCTAWPTAAMHAFCCFACRPHQDVPAVPGA
jgi:hypothetical protein